MLGRREGVARPGNPRNQKPVLCRTLARVLRIFFFGAVVRLMLRPPGYHPKKQRALYGGYIF